MTSGYLNEEQTWTGTWWLDGTGIDWSGTLVYDPRDGICLSVTGAPVEFQPGGFVVHGQASGERITLFVTNLPRVLQASVDFTDTTATQVCQITFTPDAAIIGASIQSETDPAFAGVAIQVAHLNSLLPATMDTYLTCCCKANPESTRKGAVVLFGDRFSTRVEETGTEYCFEQLVSQPQERHAGYRSMMIQYKPVISALRDSMSLEEALFEARCLKALVSVVADRRVEWLSIKLLRREGEILAPCWYFSRFSQVGDLNDDSSGPTDNLFDLGDMPFEVLIPAWVGVWAKFSSACEMFFAVRDQDFSDAFVEHRLVTMVTAAEAVCAKLGLEKDPDHDRFAVSRKMAIDAVPDDQPDDKRRISEMIRNERSLKERFKVLFGDLPESAQEVLSANGDAWADLSVGARNSLSHSGYMKPPFDDSRLLVATVLVTEAVVLLTLMKEMGCAPELFRKAGEQSLTLRRARDWVAVRPELRQEARNGAE